MQGEGLLTLATRCLVAAFCSWGESLVGSRGSIRTLGPYYKRGQASTLQNGSSGLDSLFSGNEPGNSSLHNGIESYPQLDSFVDLTHSIFGNGGDIEVFLNSTGSLCGG